MLRSFLYFFYVRKQKKISQSTHVSFGLKIHTRSIIGKDLNIKHSIKKIYKIFVIGFKVCCDHVSDSISELLSPATVCTAWGR